MEQIDKIKELAHEITSKEEFQFKYSVCTLVSKHWEYLEMVESFKAAGFDNSFTEFLFIDNSKTNEFDAYDGLNKFLLKAKGEYVILCHQDILLCYDNLAKLEQEINRLNMLDPNWAILSNAGAKSIKNKVIKFTESNGNTQTVGTFPSKVYSVDESFILVKKTANLALSANIGGFHLYGTDLCLVAQYLGYKAYVVEFNLLHKSSGTLNADFYEIKNKFINKYSKLLKIGYIQTTCTIMYISSLSVVNTVFNAGFILFFVRNICSLKNKLK